jgi:hypothetical protein
MKNQSILLHRVKEIPLLKEKEASEKSLRKSSEGAPFASSENLGNLIPKEKSQESSKDTEDEH